MPREQKGRGEGKESKRATESPPPKASSWALLKLIEAMQRAAMPSAEILKSIEAMQRAAMPSAEILKSIEVMQRVAVPSAEILKSIEAMQRVAVPSAEILKSIEAMRSAFPTSASRRLFASLQDESQTSAERQVRAFRNALVHGPGDIDQSLKASRALPPAPKTAREERVQRMSPPDAWQKSREASRVRRAAMERKSTDVIVLAIDIRHSTDLMNEASDQYVFASTLEEFIASSRSVVGRNRGWFANFTGDGFLAFWPTTDGTRNTNVRRALTSISELFSEFETVHIPRFASNAWRYREDTGLGVGLDHGEVAVVEVGEEATIVGRPVVGATRLVSAAYEWEVLANNHLGVYLTNQIASGELRGINVEKVVVPTKDSEDVRAYSVEYEWSQRPLHARR
jgi:class 3 adenylate cyclase